MESLIILGRQPALGLAELESLYGSDKVELVDGVAARVKVDPCVLAFDRLGGALKFCKILTELDFVSWKEIEKFLVQVSPGHAARMPEGKMQLGLSLYGFQETVQRITATGLTLKKALRKSGRSVRLTPNKETDLSTAQVMHNHLTGPTGWELVFIKHGNKTVVAQTVKVQDIDSYTIRDRGRPKRDTRVGMLPPKLAQIIINLAVGQLPEDKLDSICEIPAGSPLPKPHLGQTVLDPFCGTGVVLQEALLMGYNAFGTDIEKRMIDYSEKNLEWLDQRFGLNDLQLQLEAGDATSHKWSPVPDFVACESYLGRPLTALPDSETLARNIADCNLIIKKFLQNIAAQLPSGARLCVAVPSWQIKPDQFKHLPLIDSLADMGYNRISFAHVEPEDLIYYRSNQIVARELLVITRK